MNEGPTFNITSQTAMRDIIQGKNIYIAARDLEVTPNSPPEDMLKIVEAMKQKMNELNLVEGEKQEIKDHLIKAELELKEENPNKSSIADSIRRINNILKDAKTTGESLKEIGTLVSKASIWLGTTAAKLGWWML